MKDGNKDKKKERYENLDRVLLTCGGVMVG
jgi:hypothetical protein